MNEIQYKPVMFMLMDMIWISCCWGWVVWWVKSTSKHDISAMRSTYKRIEREAQEIIDNKVAECQALSRERDAAVELIKAREAELVTCKKHIVDLKKAHESLTQELTATMRERDDVREEASNRIKHLRYKADQSHTLLMNVFELCADGGGSQSSEQEKDD